MFQKLQQQILGLESKDIYELLLNRDIQVIYQPILLNDDKQWKAMALSPIDGIKGIFLRNGNDKFTTFYLWHELAHLLNDDTTHHALGYEYSTRKKAEEVNANVFAVLALIPKQNPNRKNILNVATELGIPSDVVIDVMYRFSFDTDMAHYFDEYKNC